MWEIQHCRTNAIASNQELGGVGDALGEISDLCRQLYSMLLLQLDVVCKIVL